MTIKIHVASCARHTWTTRGSVPRCTCPAPKERKCLAEKDVYVTLTAEERRALSGGDGKEILKKNTAKWLLCTKAVRRAAAAKGSAKRRGKTWAQYRAERAEIAAYIARREEQEKQRELYT